MKITIQGGPIPFVEINAIIHTIQSYGYNITRKENGIVCTPIPDSQKTGRQLPLPLFSEMPSPKASQGVRS